MFLQTRTKLTLDKNQLAKYMYNSVNMNMVINWLIITLIIIIIGKHMRRGVPESAKKTKQNCPRVQIQHEGDYVLDLPISGKGILPAGDFVQIPYRRQLVIKMHNFTPLLNQLYDVSRQNMIDKYHVNTHY